MIDTHAPDPNDLAPPEELVWSARECRDFDACLQQDCALPASLLMENAGAALARVTSVLLDELGGNSVLWLLGPGNNGGDAWVAARQLHGTEWIESTCWCPLGLPAARAEAARTAYRAARGVGVSFVEETPEPLPGDFHLVVDALFGIGLGRPVEGKAAGCLEAVAASRLPVLAVDQPSGMETDTGEPLGVALPATWTLSFVACKRGFHSEAGSRLCGQVELAEIGVSEDFACAWVRGRRARDRLRGG